MNWHIVEPKMLQNNFIPILMIVYTNYTLHTTHKELLFNNALQSDGWQKIKTSSKNEKTE